MFNALTLVVWLVTPIIRRISFFVCGSSLHNNKNFSDLSEKTSSLTSMEVLAPALALALVTLTEKTVTLSTPKLLRILFIF